MKSSKEQDAGKKKRSMDALFEEELAGAEDLTPDREPVEKAESFQVVVNEVQLLLAEKRTSLAMMRTGIAVFVLPLSVLSLLIATSKYYDMGQVIHLLIPLFILCGGLVFLGVYLTHRAILRIRHYDRIIQELKSQNSKVARFIG